MAGLAVGDAEERVSRNFFSRTDRRAAQQQIKISISGECDERQTVKQMLRFEILMNKNQPLNAALSRLD
jgi:hypothetical protein